MKFLARFQRLERARGRSTEAPGSEVERFSALEEAAPLPEVHSPPSGRFAPPEAPPEAPLELDRGGGDGPPFVRCQACGRDAQRGTVRCLCGAALDTPQVAEFNARVWAEHLARHRQESAEHQQSLEADLAEAQRRTAERRALGEELAREVAERERLADPPALPRWTWFVWLALLGLFLLRIHRLAALVLALVVLGVAGLWWWQRRPPGQ